LVAVSRNTTARYAGYAVVSFAEAAIKRRGKNTWNAHIRQTTSTATARQRNNTRDRRKEMLNPSDSYYLNENPKRGIKHGDMSAFMYGKPKSGSRFVGNKGKRKIRGMRKK
jgi:hypothetical protein